MTSKITVQLLAIKPLSLYSLLVLVELFCESMKFRIKPRTWGASLHRFMGPVLWHSLLFLLYSVSSCLSNSSLWCFLYSVKMLITYWDPLLFAAVWKYSQAENQSECRTLFVCSSFFKRWPSCVKIYTQCQKWVALCIFFQLKDKSIYY